MSIVDGLRGDQVSTVTVGAVRLGGPADRKAECFGMLSQPQLSMRIIRSNEIAEVERKTHVRHASAEPDCFARQGSLRAYRA